ncbi:MAG: hypothetical protein AAFR35_02970 [Pseudomonadota bacterium]
MAKDTGRTGLTMNHISAGIIAASILGFGYYLSAQPDPGATERGEPPEQAVEPGPRDVAWATRRPRPLLPETDDETDASSFFVEPPDVIKLGWGWSQARAEAIPTICIDFEPDSRDNAQESLIEITEVRDSYALSRAMDVSASVSVKTAGYSASGKAAFAQSSSVSSTGVSYLVSAEVMNSADFAGPPQAATASTRAAVRLTDDAAALARSNLEAFQDICGEGYVSATKSGARAYMLATTTTTSREDRESVRTSVKGSGWGVKVAAAASGSSNTSNERFERSLTFYQQGGAAGDGTEINATITIFGAIPATEASGQPTMGMTEMKVAVPASDLPSNAAEGIARIKKLADAAAAAGQIFEAQITPYQVLENFPRNADILAEETEMDEIAALWGAYATLYADLKEVLEAPEDYVVPIRDCEGKECSVLFKEIKGAALTFVEDLQDMTLIARDMIEDAAVACLEDEEFCAFDASSVRSPYSVRASMPILAPNGQNTLDQEDHRTIHLREPSQGRCVFGARTPGCISNAEIRGWADRTGLQSRVMRNPEMLKSQLAGCDELPASSVHIGDANDPDVPTIWYPVSVRFTPDGSPICTKLVPAKSQEGGATGEEAQNVAE